jgi:hypothetical protein
MRCRGQRRIGFKGPRRMGDLPGLSIAFLLQAAGLSV